MYATWVSNKEQSLDGFLCKGMCHKHVHTLTDTKYTSGIFNHILSYVLRTKTNNSFMGLSFSSLNLLTSARISQFGRSLKLFGSLNIWSIEIFTTAVVLHSQLSLSKAWRTLLWNSPVCPLLSWVTRIRPSGRGLWKRTSSPWSRLNSDSVWAKCVVVTLCLKKKNILFFSSLNK